MGRKNDNAVSPVIGTILLVALTVIFVAVVAVVATGLAGGMFDSKQVGLTLTPYGINSNAERGVFVTVFGGADAGDLVSLSASLNGPELVYRETNNSSVVNPAVGPDYRFKAVESNVIVTTTRGKVNKIEVDLNTMEILPVAATEYVVTVTGKFRDGTEQVLLIQKVTLPAIPGRGSVSDGQYVSVSPYSISDKYPGHGFIITPLNDSIKVVTDSVTFELTSPNTETKTLTTSNGGFTSYPVGGEKITSYDLNTAFGSSHDGWSNTPYPDLSTYWMLGELTGTVTVTVMVDDTEHTVMVPNIVIPPRVNIFEAPDVQTGPIRVTSDSNWVGIEISITQNGSIIDWNNCVNKGSTVPNDNKNNCVAVVVNENTYSDAGSVNFDKEPMYLKQTKCLKDVKGNSATVEVFVKIYVNPTVVWYRIVPETTVNLS